MKLKINQDAGLQINRMQMIEIRKMDHRQLDAFLTGIYRKGREAAREEAELDFAKESAEQRGKIWKAFAGAICSVKGIGEARRQELRLAFREYLKETISEEKDV